MVKVSIEDKDMAERKPYFGVGVHEVYIEKIKSEKPEKGAPFFSVEVLGSVNDLEVRDDVRLYISEAAAPYTLANLARIAVHNKQTEKEKDAVREAFKAITDTDEIDQKFLDKFKDMQAWILVEEDMGSPKPNGGYYTRASLYSYKPQASTNASKMTAEDLVSDNNEKIDLEEIPFE